MRRPPDVTTTAPPPATVPLGPGGRSVRGRGRPPTTPDHLRADFPRRHRQYQRTGSCHHPVRLQAPSTPSTWPPASCAPSTTPPTSPAGCCCTACGNRRETVCPPCSPGLQARRPPARPRGPVRRQGRPRVDRRAPVRVRHLHRPLVRPGPLPPDARQDRAALPPPPRRRSTPLPARPRHLLPRRHDDDDPRLGRPLCPDCYDYNAAVMFNAHAGRPVAPVHHLPAPPPRPPRRAHPESSSASWSRSATSRSPNTRPAASSTSTPSSA